MTWTSGGEPLPYQSPVLEDPSAPHQIISLRVADGLAVTCNCLRQHGPVPGSRGAPRQLIAVRTGSTPFPVPEALAAWRGWHAEHGVTL